MGNTTPQAAGGEETSTRITPRWTLGDRFRKIRRESGFDQKRMAEVLDVDKATYANWEYDRSMPKNLVAVAARIELATGVTAEWLLGMRSPEPTTPDERMAEEAEREEIVQRILAATLRAQGERGQKIGLMPSHWPRAVYFLSPSGLAATLRDDETVQRLVRGVA